MVPNDKDPNSRWGKSTQKIMTSWEVVDKPTLNTAKSLWRYAANWEHYLSFVPHTVAIEISKKMCATANHVGKDIQEYRVNQLGKVFNKLF